MAVTTMATAPAAASGPLPRPSSALTSGAPRRGAGCGFKSLGALTTLLLAALPRHVQAGGASAAAPPRASSPWVVSETALHEEDEAAGAGELFKSALRANLRRSKAPATSAVEDSPHGSHGKPYGKAVVAESTLLEEFAGDTSGASVVESLEDSQAATLLPAVEMESSMSEEDAPVFGMATGAMIGQGRSRRPGLASAAPTDFAWPDARELSAEVITSTVTTATETSTTTGTTTTVTTTTVPGGEAPAPSPNSFQTSTNVQVTFVSEPSSGVLEVLCDKMRFVVANEGGITPELVECVGFQFTFGDLQDAAQGGNRRLSASAGFATFNIAITSESEAEAVRVNTEVSSMVPAAATAALVAEVENDATVSEEVKTVVQEVEVVEVEEVTTVRVSQVRAMRGTLQVTVDNSGYTNQQVIDFITDMLVQALENTANTNVLADNITVSVDSSTSIRFTIWSFEAVEDLAILDALSQSDTVTVLQAVLDGSNVEITIVSLTPVWEVYGTFTVASGAALDSDQQKLTDTNVWSVDSMSASVSTAAQTLYGLIGTQVGIHLLDKISYEAGVNTSNRIVMSFSFLPSSFNDYCIVAAQMALAANQATLESALAYPNSDASVLPFFESFVQDEVLAACTASSPGAPEEEDTSTATALIAVFSVVGVILLFCLVAAVYVAVKRRRERSDDVTEAALTGEDHEAGRHGYVPESTIQVNLPSAGPGASTAGPAEEMPDDEPRQMRAVEEMSEAPPADDQMLEYLDDEPRVNAV